MKQEDNILDFLSDDSHLLNSQSDIVLLKEFGNDLVAQLAVAQLRENNITFHLTDNVPIHVEYHMDNNARKLYVRKEDLEIASSLISQVKKGTYDLEQPLLMNITKIDSPLARIAEWFLILIIITYILFFLYFGFMVK